MAGRTKLVLCGALWFLALWPAYNATGAELRIAEADGKKMAIEKPAPAYPMIARQLKVSGSVAVEAVVGEDGSVQDVRILSGNPLLTKPVAEAVKKWRFKSFQADGKPSAAAVSLTFEFGTR